jgi:hypothetical protein
MHEPLRHAVAAIFCPVDELWLMLDEHQVHSRIPDLVVGRLNLDVLEQRIDGGWGRPLSQTELRALHSMRPDRGRSLRSVADHMRVGEARAREIMRGLLAEGFAERTQSGSYARRAPIRPLLDVVVSVEAKRSDLIDAFHQARAHAMFADRCVVAFDLGYLPRAESLLETYRHEGIGLLGLSAEDGDWVQVAKPARARGNGVLGRALAAERALARLLGAAVTRLPQTRLPGASRSSASPGEPVLLGPAAIAVAPLLRGLAPALSDPRPA